MAQTLSHLAIGSLVKYGKHQVGGETAEPIIWLVADKNHSGYPSNSVTLIAQKSIDLRAYDAKNTSHFGQTHYATSNIQQWLNSDASAGAWYIANDTGDTPPDSTNTIYNTPYADRAGFLYNFTPDERLAILPTTLTIQEDGYKLTTKVFLPSLWETIGSFSEVDGSTQLEYFKSSVATCSITNQAFTNTTCTANYKPTSTSVNWEYLTRSTFGQYVCSVNALGNISQNPPYHGHRGVRPVINLPSGAKTSDTPDSSGCYTISTNTSPVISGTSTNLGDKSSGFSQTYTVTDADQDVVTVKEYIDNVEIRSYVATLNATNTFAITGNTWLKLANGSHTLKIIATDGFDEATRVYTFTKKVNTLVVKRVTPLTSATKPSRLVVTVVKNIPPEAIFKVEACNNGFDATPTWEDVTSSVTKGQAHVFSNSVKTASEWGVNIRVTINRNGGEGACYITEIGGNFE